MYPMRSGPEPAGGAVHIVVMEVLSTLELCTTPICINIPLNDNYYCAKVIIIILLL